MQNFDLAETLYLYTHDYRHALNIYLDKKIKKNVVQSVIIEIILLYYLTHDILDIPKKNIVHRKLFSIVQVQQKNKNCIVDLDALGVNLNPLLSNIYNIDKFQVIGWIYIMNLNEKIILNNYVNYLDQLPESCFKESIKISLTTNDIEWKIFNRKLSKLDIDDNFQDQICSGIEQAINRIVEIIRKYD